MSKILDFPTNRIASRKLKNEMQSLRETLRDCYNKIEEAGEALEEMENVVESLEDEYNQKLLALAEEVGVENLTLEELEWASNLKLAAGSEKMQIWFENEEGDEFVFELEEDPKKED